MSTTTEAPTEQSAAEARAALDREQAELDAGEREHPDRPEGAADEIEAGSAPAHEEAAEEETLAERLRRESGIAADHAAARGETPEEPQEGPQTNGSADGQLPGMPASRLTANAGGAKPDSSEFKLNGRSLELGAATQFAKGAKLRLEVEAEVVAVEFVDKHDKETGQITGTVRRHKLKIGGYELEDVSS